MYPHFAIFYRLHFREIWRSCWEAFSLARLPATLMLIFYLRSDVLRRMTPNPLTRCKFCHDFWFRKAIITKHILKNWIDIPLCKRKIITGPAAALHGADSNRMTKLDDVIIVRNYRAEIALCKRIIITGRQRFTRRGICNLVPLWIVTNVDLLRVYLVMLRFPCRNVFALNAFGAFVEPINNLHRGTEIYALHLVYNTS